MITTQRVGLEGHSRTETDCSLQHLSLGFLSIFGYLLLIGHLYCQGIFEVLLLFSKGTIDRNLRSVAFFNQLIWKLHPYLLQSSHAS